MATLSSQNTIKKVFGVIGMEPGSHLATKEYPPESIYQSILFKTAQEKLGVDAVFFYQSPTSATSIPYIFFQRLESQNKSEQSQELARLHRLAWNLGRAPLMFAALPDGNIRIYDVYTPPTEPKPGRDYQTGLIDALNVFKDAEKLRQEYHRYEFESGRYWQRNRSRFNPKNRADQTLLQNLKIMRRSLIELLPDLSQSDASEIIHSLLGRSIFIKYLEDRRDSEGNNVFPKDFFSKFVKDAASFAEVLSNKEATYQLFSYLNDRHKFNGDLFPVSPLEKEKITEEHLEELRLFLTGNARLSDRQLRFWKFYSFDVIPIEFISSIYEEFFHISERERGGGRPIKTGTYYTPHHLVELLVDEVFPWEGVETKCKTLDPACGSGIFLVEIYRRLIARWGQANPSKRIQFDQLAALLTDNIYGVDLDKGAVHVAAFSLYLTLCDFLEPRQIWEEVKFPPLRHKNLFPADFFDEDQAFANHNYDLIIGNPPWQSELTKSAEQYCQQRQSNYPDRQYAPDKQIALTFLWRAVELCKSSGEICLLMPSKGLLFNRSGTHTSFRRDFFTSYHVKTIINLSACRHIVFDKAVGAGAAIIYTIKEPNDEFPILYCSPKPAHSIEDEWRFTIEPQDIAELPRDEAKQSNTIWKTAMWGGPRDYELITRLSASSITLLEMCNNRNWIGPHEGYIEGNKGKKPTPSWMLGKPHLEDVENLDRFVVEETSLPVFQITELERPRKKHQDIYKGPHILIKQSPKAGEIGFRAALLKNNTIFSQSLAGIHGPNEDLDLLAQCCLILNSRIPLYFALMYSGRWLVERDELTKEEVVNFPMPTSLSLIPVSFQELQDFADDDETWAARVQSKIEKLYNLADDELILIDDAINYTLDYFRLKENSRASDPTYDEIDGEKHLTQYLEVMQRTLQNSFNASFQPIIFQSAEIPLRVVGLEWLTDANGSTENISFENSRQVLDKVLEDVDQYLTEQRSPSVFIRRTVRAYIGNMIYIIKPDQKRHWTRSYALRDADEIYADIMTSREQSH